MDWEVWWPIFLDNIYASNKCKADTLLLPNRMLLTCTWNKDVKDRFACAKKKCILYMQHCIVSRLSDLFEEFRWLQDTSKKEFRLPSLRNNSIVHSSYVNYLRKVDEAQDFLQHIPDEDWDQLVEVTTHSRRYPWLARDKHMFAVLPPDKGFTDRLNNLKLWQASYQSKFEIRTNHPVLTNKYKVEIHYHGKWKRKSHRAFKMHQLTLYLFAGIVITKAEFGG